MVRVLCSSTSGAGHFTPLIPFIRSFLRAGHDVMVAGPPALVGNAVGTGAVFWPFDYPPRDEMTAVTEQLPRLSTEEANAVVCREIFGRLNATAAVPRLREALDEWRPDLVLRESAEFGNAVAAELHGIPHARIAIGLGAAEDYVAGYAMESVEKLRCDHGLPRDPEARWLHAAPQLTLFPGGLEDPACSTAATSRFRDPAWDVFATRPARMAGRPFVYATFGTVAGRIPHLAAVYREVYDAVAGLDIDVLFTTGRDVDATEFGTPPPNVRVAAWIDQIGVLGEATAVLCHGGGGSTLGALAAGVPLVVVPLFAGDQFINAQRIAAVGAGVQAAPEAGAIRAALQAVLAGGQFRVAAKVLAAELAVQPSTDDALDVLAW